MTRPAPRIQPKNLRLRSAMPICIMGVLCLYFAFYLVFGPRGFLALQRIQETAALKTIEHTALVEKRQALADDVKLMRPDSLDADMADEQTRKTLGYMKPDEIVINLPDEKK